MNDREVDPESRAISSAISGAVTSALLPWLSWRDSTSRPNRGSSSQSAHAGGWRQSPAATDSDEEVFETRRPAKRYNA